MEETPFAQIPTRKPSVLFGEDLPCSFPTVGRKAVVNCDCRGLALVVLLDLSGSLCEVGEIDAR
jgi:hypothetical protein